MSANPMDDWADELVGEAPEAPFAPAVNVKTITPTEPTHAVDGFAGEIGLGMTWGRGGVSKTYVKLRQLEEQGARETAYTLFGNPELVIHRGIKRALWVSLEESPGVFAWRHRRVVAGLPEGVESALELDHVYAPDSKQHLTVFDLGHYLKAKDYQVAVLDGMTGLLPRLKGTAWDVDNYGVNDVCRHLRALSTEHRIWFEMIYHANKEGTSARGPSEWRNSVDVMVELQKDGDDIKVIVDKVRDGREPRPFVLTRTFEPNGGPFRLEYDREVTAADLTPAGKAADAFLRGAGKATQAEIQKAAGIKSRETMNTVAKACIAAGLWRDTGVKGPKGSPIYAHTGLGA